MLETLKGLCREYKLRVRQDEVVARLSAGIWKTCNRILEEVVAVREAVGKMPPVPREEAFWFNPKIDTRHALTLLLIHEEVEMKHRDELTSAEIVWASQSDSTADAEEKAFRKKYGYGELAFYRFTSSGVRKRKLQENKLPEDALKPVIVKV